MAFGDLIQSKSNAINSDVTTISATFDSATTANNLIVVICSPDKSSGAFTPLTGYTIVNESSNGGVSQSFIAKIANGTEGAITRVWATARRPAIWIAEFEGPFDESPLVKGESDAYQAATKTLASGSTASIGAGTYFKVGAAGIDSFINIGGTRSFTSDALTEVANVGTGGSGSVTAGTAVETTVGAQTFATTFAYTGGTADEMYCTYGIFEEGVAGDTVTPGASNYTYSDTITFTTTLTSLTSATLTDTNSNVFTLTGVTDTSANIPAIAAALDACLTGAVTLTVSDGTDSAQAGITLDPLSGYTLTTLTSLAGTPSWIDDWDVAAEVGDQGQKDHARLTLNADGSYSATGTTAFSDVVWVTSKTGGEITRITYNFLGEGGGTSISSTSIIADTIESLTITSSTI